MKLYDPSEGKYHLPIFDTDVAIPQYTWRELIDIYVSNYGHKVNDQKFREHIVGIMQEVLDKVTLDTYEICKSQILKEIERS